MCKINIRFLGLGLGLTRKKTTTTTTIICYTLYLTRIFDKDIYYKSGVIIFIYILWYRRPNLYCMSVTIKKKKMSWKLQTCVKNAILAQQNNNSVTYFLYILFIHRVCVTVVNISLYQGRHILYDSVGISIYI